MTRAGSNYYRSITARWTLSGMFPLASFLTRWALRALLLAVFVVASCALVTARRCSATTTALAVGVAFGFGMWGVVCSDRRNGRRGAMRSAISGALVQNTSHAGC